MSLQIKGTVKAILAEETGLSKAGKEWTKGGLVIDTGAQHNPDVAFTCFGDKMALLEKVTEGQEVDVSFNVSSREYNGKYYHSIDAWKIDVLSEAVESAPNFADQGDDKDELPF
jgi:hypothetical protein